MFRNYLIVALRNLMRQKLYAFITIFGLSLGLTGCLLIGLFLVHEWSHDRFHEHADEIYRVLVDCYDDNGNRQWTSVHSLSVVENLKESIPGIAGSCGYIETDSPVAYKEKKFDERIALVTPGFLGMFSFPLLAGDPATALLDPQSTLISESLTKKLFGEYLPDFSDIIGKTLLFGPYGHQSAVISGVMKDVPTTSSLQFSILLPIEKCPYFPANMVQNCISSLYIRITDQRLKPSMEKTLAQYAYTYFQDYRGTTVNPKIPGDAKDTLHFRMQPLTDMYLGEHVVCGYEVLGNSTGMSVLGSIAVLVLIIACSNFVTISIGRSTGRRMEAGVRKVLGAKRRQLMLQFWGEALILSILSMALGLVFAELFLPEFNVLIRQSLDITWIGRGSIIPIVGILTVFVSIAAGLYPAAALSRSQPSEYLKRQETGSGRNTVTRLLVIAQYAISIAMFISTIIIAEQYRYMNTKNLGYNKDGVVVIEVTAENPNSVALRLKNTISTYSRVISTSISDRTFTSGSSARGYKMPDGVFAYVRFLQIDPDLLNTLDIPLIAGRNFSYDYPTDSSHAVLVNETLVKTLELDSPVGRTLEGLQEKEKPVIIGVVKDFHIDNLREPIVPLLMRMKPSGGRPSVFIRIQPDDMSGTLAYLRKTWNEIAPGREYRQSFLDSNLERQYQEETRWRNIVGYGAFFAILISSMGLFGLISLAAARRTKEVGIRKVLGASIPDILYLFTKDFMKLVLLANLIAIPAAYYAMDRWLQNFAYRIDMDPLPFLLGGFLAIAAALGTIAYRIIKTARANPVEALRYE